MSGDRLLNVSAAARWLGYDVNSGPRRVRRLIDQGALRAENHGSRTRAYWMIRVSELERFRASRSCTAASQ